MRAALRIYNSMYSPSYLSLLFSSFFLPRPFPLAISRTTVWRHLFARTCSRRRTVKELDTTYSRSMMLFIYMREHKGLMLVAMIVYAWE